jgi:hypothetical protein
MDKEVGTEDEIQAIIGDYDLVEDRHEGMFQMVMQSVMNDQASKLDINAASDTVSCYIRMAITRKEFSVNNNMKEKFEQLEKLFSLKPLCDLVGAFAHYESRAKCKIYRIVAGTELGGHLERRAKDQVVARRQDNNMMTELADVEAFILELQAALKSDPAKFKGMVRAVMATCTRLVVCHASTRQIFKHECGSRVIAACVTVSQVSAPRR